MQLDPSQRYQTLLSVRDLYPPVADAAGNPLCPCGCGRAPQTRRHKWATPECLSYVLVRFRIIKGDGPTIRMMLWERDKGVCRGCGVVCMGGAPTTKEHRAAQYEEATRLRAQGYELPWAHMERWEADHIIPVEQGGGACELDGFQTLCVDCHRAKSAAESASRAATPAEPTRCASTEYKATAASAPTVIASG